MVSFALLAHRLSLQKLPNMIEISSLKYMMLSKYLNYYLNNFFSKFFQISSGNLKLTVSGSNITSDAFKQTCPPGGLWALCIPGWTENCETDWMVELLKSIK